MSQQTPTDDAYRQRVLEDHRDVFETIRDGEEINPTLREKYGRRVLQKLRTLQEGDHDD